MESGLLEDCNQIRNIGRPGYEYLGVARSLDENAQEQQQELEQETQNGGYGAKNVPNYSNPSTPSYGQEVKSNDYPKQPSDYTNGNNGNYQPENDEYHANEQPKDQSHYGNKDYGHDENGGNHANDQPKDRPQYGNKGHEHEHSFWKWGGNRHNSYEKKNEDNGKPYKKEVDHDGKSYGKNPVKPPSYGNGPGNSDNANKYGEGEWGHKDWGTKPAWFPAYFDWPPHKEYFTHHYHHVNGKWVDCTENPASISTPSTKTCTIDERYAHLDRPEWYPRQLAWPPTTCSDKWDATSVGYKQSAALQLTDNENTTTFMETNFIEIVGACTIVVFIAGVVFARKSARLLRELKEQQMLFEDNSHYQPLL